MGKGSGGGKSEKEKPKQPLLERYAETRVWTKDGAAIEFEMKDLVNKKSGKKS